MNNTDIAFLSKLIPEQSRKQVERFSVGNLQEAANALEWNLIRGLSDNTNQPIRVFNVLPIGSFPSYYRRLFVKGHKFSCEYSATNDNIGFCNVKGFRKYSQSFHTFRALKKWCDEGSQKKVLFVYTLCSEFMAAISKLKRRYPDLTVCAVVADLPNMTCLASDQNPIQKRYITAQSNKSFALMQNVDFFVLLTEQMASYLQLTQPYCVMEGIAQPREEQAALDEAEHGVKTIFYSGTLHKQFGILNLLEAFQQIEAPDYRLLLCGLGDAQPQIEAAAKSDSRIRFWGQLPREEVLRYQSAATVLVNPRQNTGDYVKYSFPSKIMEYLMSGRPLVAYRLDGIPKEYDPYIFYVPDNSVGSLKAKLTEVCENCDSEELRSVCIHAKKFVSEEKNAEKQTAVILKMLRSHGVEI